MGLAISVAQVLFCVLLARSAGGRWWRVVCVSTSWAAAREFGPRHTPEPACVLGQRSPLAHTGSEAFGRNGGRTRGASGIYASKPPISHKVIARLDKYQTPLLSLIRPIARLVGTKLLHSSKPLQRQPQTDIQVWQPRNPTPMGPPPPPQAQQTSSPITVSVHS